MSSYIIVQLNIINTEGYKKYIESVTPIVKKYKGKYLVRGGKYKILLGNWDFERTVIIQFPSYELANNFYKSKEYAPIKKIREDNSEGNVIITEGI